MEYFRVLIGQEPKTWFIVLFTFFVIGQSNYFGFGFTTLNCKPLYTHHYYIYAGVKLQGRI